VFEFAAPLMLLVRSDRARTVLVVFLLGFHLMVFGGLRIIFLPHCVAILSILPWERFPDVVAGLRRRVQRGRVPAVPAPAPPA
jgi:hypothetical protein